MLFSEHWAAPVYLELLTTNTHTTRLEVVSALHGRSMDRVVEGRQLDLEDQHSSPAPDRGVATRPLAGLEICFAIG